MRHNKRASSDNKVTYSSPQSHFYHDHNSFIRLTFPFFSFQTISSRRLPLRRSCPIHLLYILGVLPTLPPASSSTCSVSSSCSGSASCSSSASERKENHKQCLMFTGFVTDRTMCDKCGKLHLPSACSLDKHENNQVDN